jgi:hypothetical protein
MCCREEEEWWHPDFYRHFQMWVTILSAPKDTFLETGGAITPLKNGGVHFSEAGDGATRP